MDGSRLDDLARHVAERQSRRSAFGLLGFAIVTFGGLIRGAQANNNKKKKNKAGKKAYKQCKKTAEEYCTTTYNPPFEETCTSYLKKCCKYFKKCKNSKAVNCKVALPW